jgi:acyl-CoA reductase-like NAD-dependent aldehyde dehydrogenase
VAQGLSSAIMTNNLRSRAFYQLQVRCGIANVNIGTSGAEIGGAGGEKKRVVDVSQVQMHGKYMRRQTNTINYRPLAFGTRNKV